MDIFDVQDLANQVTVLDTILVLLLSFALSAFIGWIYQTTHRGTSYTQSFVFTLVLNGMVVAFVMMIVGSNLARAFSLVGALSIIRFRNAIKETRDVGFIFFTMAVGMAVGTQFYVLAVVATLGISAAIIIMIRFNWYAREMSNQILRVQVPNGTSFDELFEQPFRQYTHSAELISADTVQNGALMELTYSIGMRRAGETQRFLADIQNLSGANKVTLIAGYNNMDL